MTGGPGASDVEARAEVDGAVADHLERQERWPELLAYIQTALATEPLGSALFIWKAREAWCLLAMDAPEAAARAAEEGVGMAQFLAVEPEAAVRVLLVLGYLAGMRGDHRASSSWRSHALRLAPTGAWRAEVLLALGTSLSKAGEFALAMDRLRAAGELRPDEEPDSRSARVRAHALSRQAVVEEMLGNAALAVKLQSDAILLAQSGSWADDELLFTAHRRLARHHLHRKEWARAAESIDKAAGLAAKARRGPFLLAHERARLALARGLYEDALGWYREVLRQLPEDPQKILERFADRWKGVVTGLLQVFREADDERGIDLTERALRSAHELSSPDVFEVPASTRPSQLRNAARAAEAVREYVLAACAPLHANGYSIDLARCVARDGRTGETVRVPQRASDVLRYLLEHGGIATSAQLASVGTRATDGAVRSAVRSLRELLHLERNELIVSVHGRRGGFRLSPDARKPPRST